MADIQADSGAGGEAGKQEASSRQAATPAGSKRRKRANMHEGIAVWCDCCSCEAEPYWVAVAEEMGIDLGSDYEDDQDRPVPDRHSG